ncbi:nucleotide-binding alpha-beta plait domain-containing protein [Tanacetum coccineum]
MGRFRSNEDDVAKISLSVYISNFPDACSAKELFNACKQYGHVVDSFIPNKRSKAGKRFGFVRFINAFNEERLVNNLCTVWIGRHKLHANLARFKRPYVSGVKNVANEKGGVKVNSGSSKSYAHVVSNKNMFEALKYDSMPSIVLEDDCLNSKDLSNTLLGRVLLEFPSPGTKELFKENRGASSWFSMLKQSSIEFIPDGRIVWVEIEGVPFKLWSKNTFKKIADKWGELIEYDDQEVDGLYSKRLCILSKLGNNIYENFKIIFHGKTFSILAKEIPGWVPEFVDEFEDEDDSDEEPNEKDANCHNEVNSDDANDEEEVPETIFEEAVEQKENSSDDPFGIYPLFNKNKDNPEDKAYSDHSIKFPPGFTPIGNTNAFFIHEENERSINEVASPNHIVEDDQNGQEQNSTNKGSKVEILGSVCSGHFKKPEASRTGGSILCALEELVKVGQAMGYNMDGCVNNISEII